MRKHLIFTALALVLALSLALPSFAASASVVYEGHNIFGFGPGNEYGADDLFGSFKGVMPGDTLTDTVSVRNHSSCCDFVKIYLRAEPHGSDNPLSHLVADRETVESMNEFLGSLHMTVWNGSQKIYEASPDQTGGLTENCLLGTFRGGEGSILKVVLEMPDDLGNDYAERIGEIDWVFVVEEYVDDDPDSPQTGEHSHLNFYLLLMTVSMLIFIPLLLYKRRKRSEVTE